MTDPTVCPHADWRPSNHYTSQSSVGGRGAFATPGGWGGQGETLKRVFVDATAADNAVLLVTLLLRLRACPSVNVAPAAVGVAAWPFFAHTAPLAPVSRATVSLPCFPLRSVGGHGRARLCDGGHNPLPGPRRPRCPRGRSPGRRKEREPL